MNMSSSSTDRDALRRSSAKGERTEIQRTEYSDRIIKKNQRETLLLNSRCNDLDRARKVMSNNMISQQAIVLKRATETKRRMSCPSYSQLLNFSSSHLGSTSSLRRKTEAVQAKQQQTTAKEDTKKPRSASTSRKESRADRRRSLDSDHASVRKGGSRQRDEKEIDRCGDDGCSAANGVSKQTARSPLKYTTNSKRDATQE